jgi:uncharacterized protein YggU (UPF0235/DUF167 family)
MALREKRENSPIGVRVYVKTIPRSSRNEVEKISEGSYRVCVTDAPEKGKANKAVIEALAKYFMVPKSSVNIAGGKSARIKIIDIEM